MTMETDAFDEIVQKIISLSQRVEDHYQLYNALLKIEDQLPRFALARLDSALSTLDPTVHSLGYLYIL